LGVRRRAGICGGYGSNFVGFKDAHAAAINSIEAKPSQNGHYKRRRSGRYEFHAAFSFMFERDGFGADTDTVKFRVPTDAKSGDTIHMIAEVKDDGTHNLKHYQRVIITVK